MQHDSDKQPPTPHTIHTQGVYTHTLMCKRTAQPPTHRLCAFSQKKEGTWQRKAGEAGIDKLHSLRGVLRRGLHKADVLQIITLPQQDVTGVCCSIGASGLMDLNQC